MHIFTIIWNALESILLHGGYWIIFVVSLFEAAPLVGSFVPGHALIILAGFLSNIGILDVRFVIAAAVTGAILGDIGSYMIGKKYGYTFLMRFGKYFFLQQEHIEKAKAVMAKHSGKALILGRFNPVTRALTPFLAGTSELPIKKFWFYDIIGCITWAVASVTVGYIFGASYEVISQYVGKFIFIATLISIFIIWAYHFINSRSHIFAKYHLYTLIVNIGALYVFFKTIEDTLSSDSSLAQLDVWVNLKMAALITPGVTEFMLMVSDIISPRTLTLLSLVLLLYLIHKKRWYHVSLVGVGLGGGLLLNGIIKVIIGRLRPENAYVMLTDYSFPSGHATLSVIFFSLVIYLCGKEIKNMYWRELFGTVNIFIFLLVGFSRLYLNVHWLSDVVAGFALGIFWLTLVMLGFKFAKSALSGVLYRT